MAEHKSSNTDTIVKIILVFFISLLSFSIGTFVGKKFSDNQHRLSTLEPAKNDEKTVSATGASGHNAQEEPLNDEQVAALANEFVDDEAQSAGKTEHVAHNEASETVETAPKHPEVAQVANHDTPTHEQHVSTKKDEARLVAALEKAEKTDKAEDMVRIPSSVAKEKAASGITKFTIQIASYPSENEAQKKAEELKKLNFEAFFKPATIKGQTWYRVNVGTYATAKEAQDHKADLLEKAHINSAIIQKLMQE